MTQQLRPLLLSPAPTAAASPMATRVVLTLDRLGPRANRRQMRAFPQIENRRLQPEPAGNRTVRNRRFEHLFDPAPYQTPTHISSLSNSDNGKTADEVILLGADISMYVMRVRVALAEKGVEYDYRLEQLPNKSPLLLEMNPIHKKIPVLIHNGKPICESFIIVEYIDDVWKGESSFLPSDPYQKSQARFWADVVQNKMHPAARKLWSTKGEELESAKKEFIEILKLLEGQLGDKRYFGGQELGFVDVALICYYTWFETYERFGNLSIEEHCPKLMAWGKRCMERDSVSKSLVDPKRPYAFVEGFRKKIGL